MIFFYFFYPGFFWNDIAEFLHQISNSGAKALVTVPELLPVLLKVCNKVGIPENKIFMYGKKDYKQFKSVYSIMALSSRSIEYPIQGLNCKEDVAFICYSSGTTGLAKVKYLDTSEPLFFSLCSGI